MADLTIEIDSREKNNAPDKQTMQVYRVSKNGTLTFVNLNKDHDMVVTPKRFPNVKGPFCEENDKNKEVQFLNVPRDEDRIVSICNAYKRNELRYVAKIGAAGDEDPIVIIEKSRAAAISLDFVLASVAGLAVGAILAVVVMRMTARKP
jgi:hypothetical protein